MKIIQLKFPRKLENLIFATTLAREIGATLLKDDVGLINNIELVVSESCTNAIKYSHARDAADDLILTFKIFPNKLVIILKDKGKGFDINNIPAPDFDKHPEKGYGVFIIKSIMDDVNYTKKKSGYNTLIMGIVTKKLK